MKFKASSITQQISNLSNRLRQQANNIFYPKAKNPFNQTFIQGYGHNLTSYDTENITYIKKGYNINSTVFSLINQMATKTASVPYYIKEIEDKEKANRVEMMEKATKFDLSLSQRVKLTRLKNDAYAKEDKPFPMERPNVDQTWVEFWALYKTFLKTTGNAYIYMLSPSDGMNKGVPMQVYLLPSQYTQIVLKDNTDNFVGESPIDHYIMVYQQTYTEFPGEDVIHIKKPNPNYGDNGEHLYGLSELAAALKNIESSNSATDLNIQTLKNGGAYGFIWGDTVAFGQDQADEVKSRLQEMKADPNDMGKITALSAKVGFTRMSLTADELKPFDYLQWDSKQIANCLIWSDKLLNNDDGAKYDNLKVVEKWVVTNNIAPDLKLLEDALNEFFLPRFKGYENCCIKWDVMELPEMQADMATLTGWLNNSLDRAVVNREEYREAIGYTPTENPEMQEYTTSQSILKLGDALEDSFTIE